MRRGKIMALGKGKITAREGGNRGSIKRGKSRQERENSESQRGEEDITFASDNPS